MVPVETDYMKVRNALAPCRTLADLSSVWKKHQSTMKAMEQGERAALIAMKDFYKRMIQTGEIHEYLKAREEAASRKWSGNEIQEPPDTHSSRLVRQQGGASKVAVSSGRGKARRRR